MQTVIETIIDDLPSNVADRLGVQYTGSVKTEHKKENGQYFTPSEIAKFMASLAHVSGSRVRILDPGCGTAILSCALVEHLIESNSNIQVIELVLYETDSNLIPITETVIHNLKSWAVSRGINLNYEFRICDFVIDNASVLNSTSNLFPTTTDSFDIIISNPPYFKLSKDDPKTLAAKEIVSGQPNIYSFFMAIASKLLKKEGQLIFITPRSFASGNYFKTFREFFFNEVEIDKVHLFNSRKDTFGRDSVLQETVIIKAINTLHNRRRIVNVSTSNGLRDICNPEIRQFKLDELIDFESKEKFFHIPSNELEESILQLVKRWEGNLNKYNIQISTGPVVAHRAWNFIKDGNFHENYVPLIWMHNVNKMSFEWPVLKNNKGQYILISDASNSLLLPNKDYILLRRFSSKDDSSRLIACPYFSDNCKSDFIGIENKVNYIYRPKGILEKEEVIGLCALLNSELFDNYFRMFNGNVNVSATELREMSFPKLEEIKEIGSCILATNDYSSTNINQTINGYYKTAVVSAK